MDALERLFVFLMPLGVLLPGAGRKQDVHGASGVEERVGDGLAALNGADGFGKRALVGIGEERIRPDYLKGQTPPDDRLAQEQSHSGRKVQSGLCG